MYHHILLFVHIICACIWVGGHLILLCRYVPEALKEKSTKPILAFRKRYESIGMPSLLLLIVTGILMAYDFNVTASTWFHFANPLEKAISLKLILVLVTLLLASIATRFIFPKLSSQVKPILILFISLVTTIAMIIVFVGTTIRYGGL